MEIFLAMFMRVLIILAILPFLALGRWWAQSLPQGRLRRFLLISWKI